uniref:Vitellogenin domain-containing protein n=1 Tax=Sphaeramia orbicularis TaxID=375764 RepID=A0A673A3G0_9TELE
MLSPTIFPAPQFKTNKLYEYKYEAAVLGKLPEDTKSGLKMTSKVHISFYFLLKVKLVSNLMKPIKFRYENGEVKEVSTADGVSIQAQNIANSILNLLQVKVKKTLNIYELYEDGTQGECKNLYVIPEEESRGCMQLMKTRDLEHCRERTMKFSGLAYTTKLAKSVTTYYYDLNMADKVQIMAVNATEVIEFIPVQEMKGAAQIMTEILPYSLNVFIFFKIEEYLRKLVQFNVNQVNENAPEVFLGLIHNLRRISYEELKNILDRHWNAPQYRSLLLKTIPAIGTNVALKFIHEKLLHGNNQINTAELIQLLIGSFHMVTADPEQMAFNQDLQQTLRNEYTGVRDILMLGYGTMISKYSIEEPERADKYVKDDIHEILLLLKVLGNTGHPSAIKSISKCLLLPADKPEVKRIRTEAIGAMKNIAKKHHRMETVLPLYLDKTLDSELRILACWLLFESKPRLTMVSTMVRSLRTERDIQVASFVHSLVWQMSQSTAAIHAELLNLRRRWESLDFVYSKPCLINDHATLFPKTIVAKTSAYFSGATADVLEVGVKLEGLQEALRKKQITESQDRLTKIHFRNLPARGPLFSAYAKVFGQEIAFVTIDKPMITKAVEVQFKSICQPQITFYDTLFMKCVIPTIGGIPFEMSLSTAAVAAADVQAATSDNSQLAENMSKVIHKYIYIYVLFRIDMTTFAVMGANTEALQVAILSRAKFSSFVPAKIIDILPVSMPKNILQMEVQVGQNAARKMMKQVDQCAEEIIEGRPILTKLRKILAPSHRNSSRSASSSSSVSSSSSSSSSSSHPTSNAIDADKSFDDPNVTILLKVVRADMKPQGYQITTYMDRSTTKLHMILADLAEDWMVRADVVPRVHRAIVRKKKKKKNSHTCQKFVQISIIFIVYCHSITSQ